MASVTNDGGGRHRVQFSHQTRGRVAIRLGKVSRRTAEGFARRVEQLLECRLLNQPLNAELAAWATGLDDRLASKLAHHELLPARSAVQAVTLAAFIRRYVDGRNDVKPASKEVWRQGEKGLCDFFGGGRLLADITPGDAESYKQHLIGAGLATATIKKRLDFGRMVFANALKHRLLSENPFAEVRVKVALPNREHFITHEETERLIDACPDEDWRIIIALARYGGLRCPSEVLSVRWQNVNFDPQMGTIVVESPKTAHHPGKDQRVIPLFGLLRPHLERAFEAAPEGATHVVGGGHREKALGPSGWRTVNLRTQFLRIIARAGLNKWPRLFHNLRSSRATELMDQHGPNDVCRWMGHGMRVAERHYLQVRPEAIAAAVAEGASQAAQNPAQQAAVRTGRVQKAGQPAAGEYGRNAAPSDTRRNPAKSTSGEGGIRTRGPAAGETAVSAQGGAESGALNAGLVPAGLPPALAALWPTLAPEARREILAALGCEGAADIH
jgi:integrase